MVNVMTRSQPWWTYVPVVLPGLMFAGWLATVAPVAGQNLRPSPSLAASDRCRPIKDGASRAPCYEKRVSDSIAASNDQPNAAAWRLVRTPNPAGGRDAVSIMHTAELTRSDLDLAGLMLRCADSGIEVLFVVVEPISPRSHPKVTVATGPTKLVLSASAVPPGLLVLLPVEAAALAEGPWQKATELSVVIEGDRDPVRGVVLLAGLGGALQLLRSNCPTQ
jgi:hypothetical protein